MTSPGPLSILPLTDPQLLAGLAAEAEARGWRMVSRLMQEWADGSNRFDRPGERAYVAAAGDGAGRGRVVAVGGLNVDSFAGDPAVGRVRRVYVAAAYRRRGVGAALVRRLVEDARGHFRLLRLRTGDAGASAFYEAVGFVRVVGDPDCTHCRSVGA